MDLLRKWLAHSQMQQHGTRDLGIRIVNDFLSAVNGALKHRYLNLAAVLLVAQLWKSFFRVFFFLVRYVRACVPALPCCFDSCVLPFFLHAVG